MSLQLIDRSPDLRRLRDERYCVEVLGGKFLLVHDVPYVNKEQNVLLGILVTALDIQGDIVVGTPDHTVYFNGEMPCDNKGQPLTQIVIESTPQILEQDLTVTHRFSTKPLSGKYDSCYAKMSHYASILQAYASAVKGEEVDARSGRVFATKPEESVFIYPDTASSRVGISLVNEKLMLDKVAIVGLGGTGSYILDLVSKTPIGEIHLFDGDKFYNHNAFRAPGAASIEDLNEGLHKVKYFQRNYSKMRRGIIPHECNIDEENLDLLQGMNFVFLCMGAGGAKGAIVKALEQHDIPYIDVGMSLYMKELQIGGQLRVTTCTKQNPANGRIALGDVGEDEYGSNIQIADLNALNAALAVIKWKKLYEFYFDLDREHSSFYTVHGNVLDNRDNS